MRVVQDARFRLETAEARLRWHCESCAMFDGSERCVHGFPTENHREARYRDPDADVLFCKEFELV